VLLGSFTAWAAITGSISGFVTAPVALSYTA
jgi:hypothetical protein